MRSAKTILVIAVFPSRSNLAQLVKDAAEAQRCLMPVYSHVVKCVGRSSLRMTLYTIPIVLSPVEPTSISLRQRCHVSNRPLLLGFIRLRLKEGTDSAYAALQGRTALIRELHVYGALSAVGTQSCGGSAQHLGIGRTLSSSGRSHCTTQYAYERCAIISGVGVRDYYRKHGYAYVDTYMVKSLPRLANRKWDHIIILCLAIYMSMMIPLL